MSIQHIKIKVRLVVEPDGDEFYVYCPELKGVHAGGATEQEALQHGREAVASYIHSLLRHDDPIPLGALESHKTYSTREMLSECLSNIRFFGKKPASHSYVEELCVN